MPNADPAHLQNPERLAAVRALCLLDTPADPAFDRLTRLAARFLNAPVSLVTLVDADRQFFKSQIGLGDHYAALRETPLSHSFCQHVVATDEPLNIEDARIHPLVHDNLAIRDLSVIAYLGMPLRTSDGDVLGSFCVIDNKPRAWTPDEIETLNDLALSVMTEIELRAEIQQRREAEAALRQSEHHITTLLNHAPLLLYALDLEGRITMMRGRETSLIPVPVEAMIGQSVVELHRHDAEMIAFYRAALGGSPVTIKQVVDDRVVNCMLDPMYHNDALIGCVGLIIDVTAQARAEHSLKMAFEQLRELESLKTEMMRIATHDLKNPLNNVLGYADMLHDEPLTEAQQHMVNVVTESAHKMLRIINEFLSLDRIEAVRLGGTLRLVNLGTLAEKAFRAGAAQASEKGIAIYAELAPGPLLAMGDGAQLLQAMINLVENSIKYTPPGRRVWVRMYEQDDDRACFEVQDEGFGIPDDEQTNVFEPFYRVVTPETTLIEGSGLGLHLVKRIVERHGGSIGFESTYGEGSRFCLHLPLAPDIPLEE